MEGATLPAVMGGSRVLVPEAVELAARPVPRLAIVPISPRRARYPMPPPAPATGGLVDVYG